METQPLNQPEKTKTLKPPRDYNPGTRLVLWTATGAPNQLCPETHAGRLEPNETCERLGGVDGSGSGWCRRLWFGLGFFSHLGKEPS